MRYLVDTCFCGLSETPARLSIIWMLHARSGSMLLRQHVWDNLVAVT